MNDEIQALRRMAQVLARVATPIERQNIARRVAQKAKGDDSELALTLAHAAALFWPGDDEKTAEVLRQVTLAFDAGELGGFIPREHRHILFTDLTVWPDCPPMAADSPLRYWVPDAPAQPQVATPAPVVADSASNAHVVPFKKAALIAAHVHEWPTIERDISDAKANGLATAAKSGARGWREADALTWARAKGKLISAAKPADSLTQAMHNLGALPPRKHTIQG